MSPAQFQYTLFVRDEDNKIFNQVLAFVAGALVYRPELANYIRNEPSSTFINGFYSVNPQMVSQWQFIENNLRLCMNFEFASFGRFFIFMKAVQIYLRSLEN